MITLAVEGWRMIPHSYSIVNQHLCLQWLRRSDVILFHREFPYLDPHWQPVAGLLDPDSEAALWGIPEPDPGVDNLFRIAFPFDLAPATSDRIGLFTTVECCIVPPERVINGSLDRLSSQFHLITTSEWSKVGLLRSGVLPEQISVVPCGIDVGIYHPVSAPARAQLRQELGWEGFVFLNIGGVLPGKGFDLLLKGFAAVAQTHPEARLVLKGSDLVYPGAQDRISEVLMDLPPTQVEGILQRLIYIGEALPFAEMARLYQAADAYVSPYLAEGFNMPVLEAIACGLPVICTQGGSTDDFTRPEFALPVQSRIQPARVGQGSEGFVLIPSLEHLIEQMQVVIERTEFRQQAGQEGPKFVAADYSWKSIAEKTLRIFVK